MSLSWDVTYRATTDGAATPISSAGVAVRDGAQGNTAGLIKSTPNCVRVPCEEESSRPGKEQQTWQGTAFLCEVAGRTGAEASS